MLQKQTRPDVGLLLHANTRVCTAAGGSPVQEQRDQLENPGGAACSKNARLALRKRPCAPIKHAVSVGDGDGPLCGRSCVCRQLQPLVILLLLFTWKATSCNCYPLYNFSLLQNRPLFQVIYPDYLWARNKKWILSRVQRLAGPAGDKGLLSRVEPPTRTKGPPFVPVGGSTRDKRSNPFYSGW